MQLIRPLLTTLLFCVCAPAASAADPGSAAMGLAKPGGGVKSEAGPAPKPVYTCDVNDWSKPLATLQRPGILGRSPPPNSMWTCALPRKSGGYGVTDLGAPCTCDAYGARWAGKIAD